MRDYIEVDYATLKSSLAISGVRLAVNDDKAHLSSVIIICCQYFQEFIPDAKINNIRDDCDDPKKKTCNRN